MERPPSNEPEALPEAVWTPAPDTPSARKQHDLPARHSVPDVSPGVRRDTPFPIRLYRDRFDTQQLLLPLEWSAGDPEPLATFNKDLRYLTGRLLTDIIEVMDGRRPLRLIEKRLSNNTQAFIGAGLRHRVWYGRGLQLQSLHISHPSPAAIEACGTVILRTSRQCKALAARLDHQQSLWQCTVLRLIE